MSTPSNDPEKNAPDDLPVAYHTPALLSESIDALAIEPSGTYVDVTFGGGGHSRVILEHLGDKGVLYGFDQDLDAWDNSDIDDDRFIFIRSNFRYLQNFLEYYDVESLDGVLADLGVSSHHFDTEERGFSFRFDAPLDMRMNQSSTLTAATILNTYDEEPLADLFYRYGELKNSRQLARHIVKARQISPLERINDLLMIVAPLVSREKEKKVLAQIFQALRIEVNDEMGALREMLEQSAALLKDEGRIAVITYHSLEDRLVKNFFRSGNFDGKLEKDFFGNAITPFRLINSKVIVPSAAEQQSNPRSRSAKLRIAAKRPLTDNGK